MSAETTTTTTTTSKKANVPHGVVLFGNEDMAIVFFKPAGTLLLT
jgi:hypothetical protein